MTTICHCPRPRSSTAQRALSRKLPRPVRYASLIADRGSMMIPPVGKSGPWMKSSSVSSRAFGALIRCRQAPTSSSMLCGGMLVAIPTAIPDEPLASRFGNAAGSTTGSCSEPS